MFTRKMVGEVHGRNRDLSGGCVLAAAAELLALGSSHVIQCDRSNDAVATCGNKRVTCRFSAIRDDSQRIICINFLLVWIRSSASQSFTEWSNSHETSNQHLIQWIAKTLGQNSTSSWPPRPWVPILVLMWWRSVSGQVICSGHMMVQNRPNRSLSEISLAMIFCFTVEPKNGQQNEPKNHQKSAKKVPGARCPVRRWSLESRYFENQETSLDTLKVPYDWKPFHAYYNAANF